MAAAEGKVVSAAILNALKPFDKTNKGLRLDLNGMQCFAKCIGVYDGDTVTLTFPFAGGFYYSSCRCLGYNTAEIRTKDPAEKIKGLAARDFVRNIILDTIVWAEFGPNDKYGRPLVSVYPTEIEKSQNRNKRNVVVGGGIKEQLMAADLAEEYYGKGEKKF